MPTAALTTADKRRWKDLYAITIEASAGDFVFGPRHVPHRYKVGDAGSRMLFVLTPGGFEELVRATSDPARSRTLPPPDHPMPDDDRMAVVSRRQAGRLAAHAT